MEENAKKQAAKGWFIAAEAGILALAVGMIVLTARSGGQQHNIDEAKAKSIVLAHAGVEEADLAAYRFAMDTDDGKTVYQLDFSAGEYDYVYAVSGTGEIVGFEKELNPGAPVTDGSAEPPTPVSQEPADGLAKTKEIALDHAGLSEDDLTDYTFATKVKNGVQIYELEFVHGDLVYEYEIDPAAGTVLKAETEQFNPARTPQVNLPDAPSAPEAPSVPSVPEVPGISANPPIQNGNSGSSLIGEAAAKSAALTHAGVAEADIYDYSWKLDWEDGVQVYEIDFHAGSYEYEYEINAVSGAVVKSDKEWDDDAPPAVQGGELSASSESYIGQARAQEIALSHAGLSAAGITSCDVELDHHDSYHHGSGHHGSGCCVYEVDFHCGGYEYDYKIDARTGAVLQSEKEWDD